MLYFGLASTTSTVPTRDRTIIVSHKSDDVSQIYKVFPSTVCLSGLRCGRWAEPSRKRQSLLHQTTDDRQIRLVLTKTFNRNWKKQDRFWIYSHCIRSSRTYWNHQNTFSWYLFRRILLLHDAHSNTYIPILHFRLKTRRLEQVVDYIV